MAFATQDLGGCATGFCGGYRRWPPTPVAGTGRRRRRSGKPSPPTSTSDHRRHRLRCRTCNLPARRLPPTATRGRQSWRHDRPTGRGSAIEKKKTIRSDLLLIDCRRHLMRATSSTVSVFSSLSLHSPSHLSSCFLFLLRNQNVSSDGAAPRSVRVPFIPPRR